MSKQLTGMGNIPSLEVISPSDVPQPPQKQRTYLNDGSGRYWTMLSRPLSSVKVPASTIANGVAPTLRHLEQ